MTASHFTLRPATLSRALTAGALIPALLFLSCTRHRELPRLTLADSLAIVRDNVAHRAEVDSFFRSDPGSPFRRDTSIEYNGIKWFPVHPSYRASSLLHRYEKAETVLVMGTRGEQRRQLRYGYFEFDLPDHRQQPTTVRLNVYKFTPYDGQRYVFYKDHLSVWFTDSTTGAETYDVGRYVEVGNENPDPSYRYVIDLNKAFNPYCAYSHMYSCAIPREEDRIPLSLRVGEMKYHE